MTERAAEPRLKDIVEAIGYVRTDMGGMSLEQFKSHRGIRWQVERGLEIVSEASRHLPAALKARHPHIPWRKIAGVGNVLRHDYARIAADTLWRVVRDDLDALEIVCRDELAALPPADL